MGEPEGAMGVGGGLRYGGVSKKKFITVKKITKNLIVNYLSA